MPDNVLLLQGPMGPFFKRLSRDLEDRDDSVVYKINFNAGDWLFYRGKRTISYLGTLEQWPDFLAEKLTEWKIDRIYLFGDTRAYHQIAREVARRLSIKVGVFEEGYLRPWYVTLEEGGVNSRSSLPRDPDFYRKQAPTREQPAEPIRRAYCRMGWYANWYFIAGWLGRHKFLHYEHHRPFNPYHECFLWWRAGLRKYLYRVQQRGILGRLETELSGKYFLVPLQVYCDGQISTCENVSSAAAFIRRVIGSFVRNAPPGTLLVLKHHPLDRGYSNYKGLIQKLTQRYGCQDRVIYVHDLHLPTLLEHALGTIVINSTTALSSLFHNTPVIALGHTIYNMEGMTYQGKLDDFWQAPGTVDQQLFRKFRNYLLQTNQLNGNFYALPASVASKTGMDVQRLAMQDADYSIRKHADSEAPGLWAEISWNKAEPVLPTDSDVTASTYVFGATASKVAAQGHENADA